MPNVVHGIGKWETHTQSRRVVKGERGVLRGCLQLELVGHIGASLIVLHKPGDARAMKKPNCY